MYYDANWKRRYISMDISLYLFFRLSTGKMRLLWHIQTREEMHLNKEMVLNPTLSLFIC
jgi:hypothetical protein